MTDHTPRPSPTKSDTDEQLPLSLSDVAITLESAVEHWEGIEDDQLDKSDINEMEADIGRLQSLLGDMDSRVEELRERVEELRERFNEQEDPDAE